MMQLVLIGIGAGLASALLYVSLAGGTSLAIPLFWVTGVPIAIAGFGWTPLAAAIACLAGATALFLFMSSYVAVAFLLLFGVPIAWCIRLASLSRTVEDGSTEWYPYGRLLLHAVGTISAGLVLYGVMIGYDGAAFVPEIATALQPLFADRPDLPVPPSREELEAYAWLLVRVLPYAFGASALLIIVLDLWLGAFVARKSGRMTRPEEPIWTVALPFPAVIAFVAALALSFLPAPLGDIAAVFAGAAAAALALVGLAVLHAITIGNSSRRFFLFGTYFLLVFFSGAPLLLLAGIGLAETLFQLRARRFRGSPPTT